MTEGAPKGCQPTEIQVLQWEIERFEKENQLLIDKMERHAYALVEVVNSREEIQSLTQSLKELRVAVSDTVEDFKMVNGYCPFCRFKGAGHLQDCLVFSCHKALATEKAPHKDVPTLKDVQDIFGRP